MTLLKSTHVLHGDKRNSLIFGVLFIINFFKLSAGNGYQFQYNWSVFDITRMDIDRKLDEKNALWTSCCAKVEHIISRQHWQIDPHRKRMYVFYSVLRITAGFDFSGQVDKQQRAYFRFQRFATSGTYAWNDFHLLLFRLFYSIFENYTLSKENPLISNEGFVSHRVNRL